MSEQNRPQVLAESISALMDNQASELELQRILKASEQDAEVKATWARYQIASSLLRGEQAPIVMSDFAARISAAIDEEDALVAQPTPSDAKPMQGWRYQLGRVALVASVAGGMILGIGELNVATVSSQIATNTPVAPIQSPVDTSVALPSGIGSPMINTRNVAVQTGYEVRPQENRRVNFQPRQPNSVVSDDEVSRYVNQMIKAHSDNAAMNSGQGVLPYARVIITDEE